MAYGFTVKFHNGSERTIIEETQEMAEMENSLWWREQSDRPEWIKEVGVVSEMKTFQVVGKMVSDGKRWGVNGKIVGRNNDIFVSEGQQVFIPAGTICNNHEAIGYKDTPQGRSEYSQFYYKNWRVEVQAQMVDYR